MSQGGIARGPASSRPGSVAGVGIVWALLLWLLAASPWRPPGSQATPAVTCPDGWVELEAEEGATRHAGCGDVRAIGRPVRGPARLLLGLPIDVNRASARTLEALPGIGARRAAAIVRARCTAPFVDLADLQRVRGIGPATVAGLRAEAIAGPAAPDCTGASTLPP